MSRNLYRLLGVAAFVAVAVFALGLISPQGTAVNAQTKTEICDNKIDDDGDKLIDCEDPDCKCEPPKGTPCSPGYWKNHLDVFNATCGSVDGWSCEDLLTAITCRGSNASCRRQEAASALNAVSGCTE
jgi:hypothetical protein